MSFVRRNNLGDITAKAQAQGLAAYLAGMGLGVGLTLAIGDTSVAGLFGAFAGLAGAHLFFSYRALRAVRLATLNPERLDYILRHYLAVDQASLVAPSSDSMAALIQRIPLPIEVTERIILPLRRSVILGAPVEQALGGKLQLVLPRVLSIFAASKYMLWPHFSPLPKPGRMKVFVMIKRDCLPEDILQAALHGYYLHTLLHSRKLNTLHTDDILALLMETLPVVTQQLPHFLSSLSAAGWNTSTLLLPLHAQYTTEYTVEPEEGK